MNDSVKYPNFVKSNQKANENEVSISFIYLIKHILIYVNKIIINQLFLFRHRTNLLDVSEKKTTKLILDYGTIHLKLRYVRGVC